MALLISAVSFTNPNKVKALEGNHVQIIAVCAGTTNANAEFVKIGTTSTEVLDITGWRLQYRSATGVTWTTKTTYQGTIDPSSSQLAATSEYLGSEPRHVLQSGLAQAGGHIRLIDANGGIIDTIGWGSAQFPETVATPVHGASEYLKRKQLPDGSYQDTNNNLADFSVSSLPGIQPMPDSTAPDIAEPGVTSTEGTGVQPGQTADISGNNPAAVAIEVSELLPNPAAPYNDASDEFVELYNPSGSVVLLRGLKILSGMTLSYTYTFTDQTIPAGGYLVLYSRDTKLTLSNSGGLVRIVAQDGSLIDETAPYDTAKDGISWAVLGAQWQWTKQPTPGTANVALATDTAPASKVNSSKVGAATGAVAKTISGSIKAIKNIKEPKAAKAAKEKVNAAAAKKEPKASKAAKKGSFTGTSGAANDQKTALVHPLVLAVIGAAAVAYAAYEYRKDLANRIYQLKKYFQTRRESRAKV